MPADDVQHVDRVVLQPLRQVGEGGQGVVYFTDRVRINKAWDAAYKEYLPSTTFDPYVLRRMVAFVPELDEGSGRWLCENTSWPAALALNGSQVSGFLMRRIPERFRMPWGDNGADVPAALQYLLNPQMYLNRKGIDLDARTRLRLLETIADVMARLHSLEVVVGDLSPNNLLVDLDDPACFFIDCDAMRLRGQDVLPQVETPEWHVPRPGQEPTATTASDTYKFGLLAARLFTQEQMGKDLTALAGVSHELGVLAFRSLDADSTARPSMGDWLGALRSAQPGSAQPGSAQPGSVPRPAPGATPRVDPPPRVVPETPPAPTTTHAAMPPPAPPPGWAKVTPPFGTTHISAAAPAAPKPAPAARARRRTPAPPPAAPKPAPAARVRRRTTQSQAAEDHPTLYLVSGLLIWVLLLGCIVGVIWGIVKLV